MPSIVSINSAASSHEVTEGSETRLGFDVVNTSGRRLKVRVRLLGADGAPLPGWLNVSEGSELQLDAAETARVSVTATPKSGAAGSHQIRLEVFEIALPEENVDRSAPVTLTVAAAPAPATETEGGRPPWVIPALIAGLLAIVAIGGLAWWLLRDPVEPPPEVAQMPDLVGMTVEEAQAAMADVPIEEIRIELVEPAGAEPGRVVQQGVPAGADPTGTIVFVGIAGSEVPALSDVKLDAALRRLDEAKLTLGNSSTRATTDQGRDLTVVSSNPGPGTLVDPGTPVDLTLLVFRPPSRTTPSIGDILGANRNLKEMVEQMEKTPAMKLPTGTIRMQDFQQIRPGN